MPRLDRSFVPVETARKLFWWHVALVIPTIGFKYLFVRRMSFTTGLETIVESLGHGRTGLINILLLASIDFLEVLVIVTALFVIGRLLLGIPVKWLIFASVFLCLIIMGANQYSLLLVANLLSSDTLAISANWALEHPYMLWQAIGLKELGFFALALVWAFIFAWFSNLSGQSGLLKYLPTKRYSFCFGFTLIVSVLGGFTWWKINQHFPLVLRGYWSSTAIAFFKLDTPRSESPGVPVLHQIQRDYQQLVYPEKRDPAPRWLATLPTNRLKPRHVLIVTLETAPRKFYPLTDNPAFPTFYQMSRHAITNNDHYAMSPYTWWNNASILSGTYFLQKGKGIFDYGNFETDSLPSILATHGYTTTFVESSMHGWGKTTGFWNNFGFTRLLDSEGDTIPFDRSSYTVTVEKERQSFQRAWDAILDAERRNQKAMVLLATTIGHYPWLAKPGARDRSGAGTLFEIASLFDALMGELLNVLERHGLHQQVLILVTGDHGFRMRTEFESVGLKAAHGDVAFNVPFLLYGPGLFERQIQLPYVTSHVDIAPTLLALLGIEEYTWLHHGTHMLDQRLRDRVTFMMNTNLSPISGFRWQGCHYTFNELTGQVETYDDSRATGLNFETLSSCERKPNRLTDDKVRSILGAAEQQFQTVLTFFQRRASSRTQATVAFH